MFHADAALNILPNQNFTMQLLDHQVLASPNLSVIIRHEDMHTVHQNYLLGPFNYETVTVKLAWSYYISLLPMFTV